MKFLYFWILLCAILYFTSECNCYKILGVFAYSGKSHFDTFVPLLRELARRGHDVTVISHFPEKQPLPNYTDISLLGTSDIGLEVVDAKYMKNSNLHDMRDMAHLHAKGMEVCESMKTPQIQNFINSRPKFDLILQEHFNSDCYLVLNYLFKAPSIGLSSCTQMAWHYNRMGTPLNPSYVPISMLHYSDQMSFFERVHNTVKMIAYMYVATEFLFRKPQNEFIRKMFGPSIPELEDIAKNTSLFLVNSHFTLHRARPLPPSVVEVSGMHLPKFKKLPADLEKFINESEHGVIYFSLGSMIKGATFPEADRKNFVRVFKSLKQRVLWKYENVSLPEMPENVMIRKWMPQFDILNHPNVKAYIAHGGLLGTIEGVYGGVPMVTIPFFGDQFTNSEALARGGTSTVLDFQELTIEKIKKAVNFVLDPKVYEKAQQLAKLFKDRPINGLETSVWWVEYIARNGDVAQLRSAVVNMPLYQSLLLDVAVFVLAVILTILYLFYKLGLLIAQKLKTQPKKLKEN